jgi:hypothetical protein
MYYDFDTKTKRNFSKHGAGPDVMLYALTMLDYKTAAFVSTSDVFFRSHSDSISVMNNENQVDESYRTILAWFARRCISLNSWARFVSKIWIFNSGKIGKIINPRLIAENYEGAGGVSDIIRLIIFALFYKVSKKNAK